MTDEQILARAYISVAERCANECENGSYEQMQYKSVQKACERFVPRKPKHIGRVKICPICEDILSGDYCVACGQAIDWGKK